MKIITIIVLFVGLTIAAAAPVLDKRIGCVYSTASDRNPYCGGSYP